MAATAANLRTTCVEPASCSSSVQRLRTSPFAAMRSTPSPQLSVRSLRSTPSVTLRSNKQGRIITRAAAEANGAAEAGAEVKPVVKIDNQTDNFSTIVSITYGNKLGDLMDTISALKNLGLNIKRAKLEDPNETEGAKNKFYVTDAKSGEKITASQKIEDIRLTILNNMLQYHPESADVLSVGKHSTAPSRDWTKALGANMDTSVETKISIEQDNNGRFTVLRVVTQDRPGLLTDMVQILKDVSVNVLSAEIDTIGEEADDTLLISYHGEALTSSMEMLVKNALQYYLSLAEVAKDESY